MKKKTHIQNDDNMFVIREDDDMEEVKVEFIGNSMWLSQMNGFSTDPVSDISLSENQSKELFRILSQKYLVSG